MHLCILTHAPVPHLKRILQDERRGGNYDLLYQNSIRKNEDDLEN